MWITIPLASFGAAVICHALWRRLFRGGTAVSGFAIWSSVWGSVAAIGEYVATGLEPVAVAGLLVYVLSCELYVFAFTLASHSVSAMLLAKLQKGPCRLRDLELLCSPGQMVQKRTMHMLQSGLLEGVDSDYSMTDRGRHLLHTFDRFRRFFFPPLGTE